MGQIRKAHSMSEFKVGETVKPSLIPGDNLSEYEIAAIFSDNFGDVLLREIGGKGYGACYCKKVQKLTNIHRN